MGVTYFWKFTRLQVFADEKYQRFSTTLLCKLNRLQKTALHSVELFSKHLASALPISTWLIGLASLCQWTAREVLYQRGKWYFRKHKKTPICNPTIMRTEWKSEYLHLSKTLANCISWDKAVQMEGVLELFRCILSTEQSSKIVQRHTSTYQSQKNGCDAFLLAT